MTLKLKVKFNDDSSGEIVMDDNEQLVPKDMVVGFHTVPILLSFMKTAMELMIGEKWKSIEVEFE